MGKYASIYFWIIHKIKSRLPFLNNGFAWCSDDFSAALVMVPDWRRSYFRTNIKHMYLQLPLSVKLKGARVYGWKVPCALCPGCPTLAGKVAPSWHWPPNDPWLYWLKLQEWQKSQDSACSYCCYTGDKTSDSLIDGFADLTIPCESTE